MRVRKGGGEEIPFVQGKQQRLRFAGAAVKRYPTPKVRGGDGEHQAAKAQERPRGAIPGPRSGAAGKRSYPMSEFSGGPEEPPSTQGQGWRPGGATRGAVAAWAQEDLEEVSHVEGQERWR